jgi:hypothetical protein
MNMGFKNEMILYYYAVLNRVTQNAQDIADRLGFLPGAPEGEDKSVEENMYG